MLLSILKWLDEKLEETILAILLLAMVLASGGQIFMRYVARSSLSWSEELTRYLFIWTGFIAIGYCYKRSSSLRIDALLLVLPKKIRLVIEIMVSLLSIALFVFLLIVSRKILFSKATQMQVSAAMQIPMSWIYAAPVVGFGLSIFRVIQCVVVQVKELFSGSGKRPGEETTC